MKHNFTFFKICYNMIITISQHNFVFGSGHNFTTTQLFSRLFYNSDIHNNYKHHELPLKNCHKHKVTDNTSTITNVSIYHIIQFFMIFYFRMTPDGTRKIQAVREKSIPLKVSLWLHLKLYFNFFGFHINLIISETSSQRKAQRCALDVYEKKQIVEKVT